jgi:hypothetical protein
MQLSSSLRLRVALVASVILGLFALLAVTQIERSDAGVNKWTFCGKVNPYWTASVKNRVGCKEGKKLVAYRLKTGKTPKGWIYQKVSGGETKGLKFILIQPKRPAEVAAYFKGEPSNG